MLDLAINELFPLTRVIGRGSFDSDLMSVMMPFTWNDRLQKSDIMMPFDDAVAFHEIFHWHQFLLTTTGTFLAMSADIRLREVLHLTSRENDGLRLAALSCSDRAPIVDWRAPPTASNGSDLSERLKLWFDFLVSGRTFFCPEVVRRNWPDRLMPSITFPYNIQQNAFKTFDTPEVEIVNSVQHAERLIECVRNDPSRPFFNTFRGETLGVIELFEAWACALELMLLIETHRTVFETRFKQIIQSSYDRVFRLYFGILGVDFTLENAKTCLVDIALVLEISLNPFLPPTFDFYSYRNREEIYPPLRFSKIVRSIKTLPKKPPASWSNANLAARCSELKNACGVPVASITFLQAIRLTTARTPTRYVDWYSKFQSVLASKMLSEKNYCVTNFYLHLWERNDSALMPPLMIDAAGNARINSALVSHEDLEIFLSAVIGVKVVPDIMLGHSKVVLPMFRLYADLSLEEETGEAAKRMSRVFNCPI